MYPRPKCNVLLSLNFIWCTYGCSKYWTTILQTWHKPIHMIDCTYWYMVNVYPSLHPSYLHGVKSFFLILKISKTCLFQLVQSNWIIIQIFIFFANAKLIYRTTNYKWCLFNCKSSWLISLCHKLQLCLVKTIYDNWLAFSKFVRKVLLQSLISLLYLFMGR